MGEDTITEATAPATVIGRALILGACAVALVIVGLPGLLGWQLAKVHDRYVQDLAIPGLVEVRDSQFSRGLLHSRSRIKLALAPELCANTQCPEITVNSVIHHGPIAFTAPPPDDGSLPIGRGVIVSDIDLAPLLHGLSFKPRLPQLEAITRISLGGAAHTEVGLPGARLRASGNNGGGRLRMKPLQANAQVPPSYKGLRADLDWPGFKWIADTGGQFQWSGLNAKLKGGAKTPDFWQRLQLGLDDLQWVDAQGRSLTLQGLRWDVRNQATHAGRLAGQFNLRLSQLQSHNREFGPVIVEGQAQGLGIASIEAAQADIRSLGTHSLPPALLVVVVNAIYQTHIAKLLAAGPRVQITRFLAGTPDGDISGDMQLTLPRSGQLQSTAVAEVLQRLQLNMNLRLPASLLRNLIKARLDTREPPVKSTPAAGVDAVLKQMLADKIVVARPKEAAYTIALRIHDQELTLNGKLRPWWRNGLTALAKNTAVTEEGR